MVKKIVFNPEIGEFETETPLYCIFKEIERNSWG